MFCDNSPKQKTQLKKVFESYLMMSAVKQHTQTSNYFRTASHNTPKTESCMMWFVLRLHGDFHTL